MSGAKLVDVKTSVVPLPRGAARDDWRSRVAEARRRVEPRRRGRAWINGREIGGTDPRLAHLGVPHD